MKNTLFKRILGFLLCLALLLGTLPAVVLAYDGTYTFASNSQSGKNNSTLRYYLTDENAATITITEARGYVQLDLAFDDGWYFEKWDTYFNGYRDRPILSDPEVSGSNPQNSDGYYTFFNVYGEKQPYINQSGSSRPFLYIAKGTNFYGDHKVTAVLKPIVTVNAQEGVSYTVSTNAPTTVSANQTAVNYGDNVTVSVDPKYVITSASASYGTKYTNDKQTVTISSLVKPTTLNISTRIKQHTVHFDAQGGEGTMDDQVFEYGVGQALSLNRFTREGYIFGGWLTQPNGSQEDPIANQDVLTFTPKNDGETSTLYAKWIKCPLHNFKYGECFTCGLKDPNYGISGSITDFGTGDVTLELWPHGAQEASHSITADNGTYAFNGITVGAYTIKASKANHRTRSYPVTLGVDAVTQDITLHLIGDVTCDGNVNIADVSRVYAHVRGVNPITDPYILSLGEVTGEGNVNIADVSRIYAHVRGTNSLW